MIRSLVGQDDSFSMASVERMIRYPIGQDDSFPVATVEQDDLFSCGPG